MKSLKILTAILLIGFVFGSCEQEQGIKIRVKNEYPETFKNVVMGPIEFGTIESGAKTNYEPINTVYLEVSGSTDSGAELSGGIRIPTQFRNKKYTIVIKETGALEATIDE
jgi:hypothetical protein